MSLGVFVKKNLPCFFTALVVGCLLCACASAPTDMEVAMKSLDRSEIDRLIAAAPDRQKALNQALGEAAWRVRFSEPHHTFAVKLYKDLLKAGASPEAIHDELVLRGLESPATFDLLVETGFDVGKPRASDGYSILFGAVTLDNVALVEKLIRLKVNLDPGVRDTPLGFAVMRWTYNPSNPSDVPASDAKSIAIGERLAKMLVAAGANVNARQRDDGRTPLMHAALMNRPDVVRYLLSVGADPKMVDHQGNGLSVYLDYGERYARERQEKREQELAKSREIRLMLGQFASAAAATIIGSRTSMASENKIQIINAVASDLATGGTAATNSVTRNLSNSAIRQFSALPTAQTKSGMAPSEARRVADGRLNKQMPATRGTSGSDDWRTCGPEKWCMPGDGYTQYCVAAVPEGQNVPECESGCAMTSGVIYHDTSLPKDRAYIPLGKVCAPGCKVRNSCG